jgi:ribonuclease HII
MINLNLNLNLNHFHMGCDESGRGPMFGRIYASAVILSPNIPIHPWVKDSKKLKPRQRAIARKWIEKNAIEYSVVYCEPDIIDKINIRMANHLVFNNSILGIQTKVEHVYIDGNDFIPNEKVLNIYNKNKIETIVKGDDKVPAISAASILAKEYHDDYIKELCLYDPELDKKYGLSGNKGYGAKNHLEGLKKYGTSPYHRFTFCEKYI